MEEKDEELIRTLFEREPELRRYYEEYADLERRLGAFLQKLYLPPEQAKEKKEPQKLICVIKVGDFTETEHVERELVLIKVRADERTRGELANIVDIFRAKIIDVSRESYVVEITGAEEKVNALVELLKPLGILEIVRTGKVAMYRGTRVLTVDGKEKERAA